MKVRQGRRRAVQAGLAARRQRRQRLPHPAAGMCIEAFAAGMPCSVDRPLLVEFELSESMPVCHHGAWWHIPF